ncbi:MAG: DUF433 domain-containing protein [Armatimonadetes bacterium]|nr:DUF433 domain-containing protein [Armatimonadota bacterium]
MSGALCFRNTRIPVKTLFDHLETDGLAAFYRGFPDVSPEMVAAVLRTSRSLLETQFNEKAAA